VVQLGFPWYKQYGRWDNLQQRRTEYSYNIRSGETDYSTPEAVLLWGDNPQLDDKSHVNFMGSILLAYTVYFVSGMDNKSHEQTLLVWLLFWMWFALYWKHQESNSLTLTLQCKPVSCVLCFMNCDYYEIARSLWHYIHLSILFETSNNLYCNFLLSKVLEAFTEWDECGVDYHAPADECIFSQLFSWTSGTQSTGMQAIYVPLLKLKDRLVPRFPPQCIGVSLVHFPELGAQDNKAIYIT